MHSNISHEVAPAYILPSLRSDAQAQKMFLGALTSPSPAPAQDEQRWPGVPQLSPASKVAIDSRAEDAAPPKTDEAC